MTFRDRMDRTWGLAAAVLVVALLAGGAFVAFLGRSTTNEPAAPQPVASGSTSEVATGPAPSDTEQQIPLKTPAGVKWELFRGAALPTGAGAGPTRVDGPVAAGFARTPLGALLALEQISARFAIAPDGGWRTVTMQQVVPSLGRDNYLKSREGQGDLPIPAEGWAQYVGFRFVTYTPDVAAIQLVNRNPSGSLKVSTSSVRWIDGDWKLEMQPDGSPDTGAMVVDDLSGFISFGGA